MAKPLAVLIVEAVESNLQLILRLLKKAGYKPAFEQVKTPAQLRRALKKRAWEAVISAYSLPKLDAPTALKILQEAGLELPFIVIAEKIGEEAGVDMIKAGASDWVLKDKPGRLVPVLERELKHAAERRQSKLALEALRESEEKWHSLVSATPDYIALHTSDGRFLFLNHYAKGFTEKDVIGTRLYQYISPESVTLFREKMTKAVKTWTTQHFEYYGLGDNSARRSYEAFLVPMRNKNQQVKILASARDITERKQGQEELSASEDKFKYVFEHSVSGKSITLPSGEINVNQAFCEMVGYSQAALKNRTWQELTHPEDIEITREATNKLLSGEKEWVRFNKRYIHKNGSSVWGDVGTALRRDEDGQPLYYVTSINDITEQKRAEEAVRDLSMRQEDILAAIPDILMEVDQDKVYTWANPAGLEFFGEDVIGKKAAFYFEGKQDTYDVVTPIFQGRKELIYVESWQRRKDGEKRLLAWWCQGIKDKDGNVTGALSSAEDITERKQAEEALAESEEHFHSLFKNMLNGYAYCRMLFDRGRPQDFIYLEVNDAFETLTGLKNVAGKKVSEVLPGVRKSDPVLFETFGRVALSGVTETFEIYLKALKMWFSVSVYSPRKEYFIAVFDVISERKRAEESIRSMARFPSENPNPVLRVARDGQLLYANKAALRLLKDLGWEPGKPVPEVLKGPACKAFETRTTKTIEISSREQTYSITMAPALEDEDVNLYALDITERKQAEQDLRDSEERFRSLYENATIGMYRTSPEGGILMANPALVSMLGYDSFEELSQRDLASGGFEPGYPRLEFQNRIEQDGDVRDLESAWKRKDGSIIFVRESAHLVRNENDQPLYYEGTVEDITERKQAEEALRRSEGELRTLFASMHELVMEIDRTGVYRKIAPTNPELLIKPPEELVGMHLGDVFPKNHADIFINVIRKVMDTKQPAQIEYDLPIGGRIVRFEASIAPLTEDSTLWVAHDITERKHAEEKIRQLNADLEQRVEERTRELRQAQDKIVRQEKLAVLGQLAGGVGHELRNPLGIISSGVYYLKLIQPDADAKVRQYHAMIEQEVRNSEKIITDLLDYARLESMEREQVSVPELVRSTLARFTVPESIKITLRLPTDLPRVHADLLQMEQVLGNLTVNACQAMITSSSNRGVSAQGATKGAVKGSRLSISARRVEPASANPPKFRAGQARKKGMVAISVKDNGAGISPENMSKLFEPLFTTKSKGIGLGLAVSRKLAEANGGRIEVKSEVGKGSTFTLFLPVEASRA